MPKPQYALDYSQCSTEELVIFLLRRLRSGIKPDQAYKLCAFSHDALAHGLSGLDAKDSFTCFFKLPAELRIMIYKELLVSDEQIHPQILRTSKQLHKETEPILYGDNNISVNIKCFTIYVASRGAHVRTSGMEVSLPGNKSRENLPCWARSGPVASLHALRMAQRLTISVEAVPCDQVSLMDTATVISKRIAGMYLLLSDSTRLRRVTIAVKSSNGVCEWWCKVFLSALPLLRDQVEVEFSGFDYAMAAKQLAEMRARGSARSVKPAGTLLVAAREMHGKTAGIWVRGPICDAIGEVLNAYEFESEESFAIIEQKMRELEEVMRIEYISYLMSRLSLRAGI